MAIILISGGLLLIVDQISKYYIEKMLGLGETISLIPHFFSLSLIHNSGGAFGIFRNTAPPYFFILISSLVMLAIIFFYKKLSSESCLEKLSLGLILGGSAGNLIDRIRLGAVIDFLDFSLFGHHWPAFNFADAGISLGVIFLLFTLFKKSPERGTLSEKK